MSGQAISLDGAICRVMKNYMYNDYNSNTAVNADQLELECRQRGVRLQLDELYTIFAHRETELCSK